MIETPTLFDELDEGVLYEIAPSYRYSGGIWDGYKDVIRVSWGDGMKFNVQVAGHVRDAEAELICKALNAYKV